MNRTAESHSSSKAPSQTFGEDTVVYRLARDLSDLPEDLVLRNVEWGVLLAITGEHTAVQIGNAFGLDERARREVFLCLEQHDLVEERPLSFGEYLRAQATIGGQQPRSLSSFLQAGVTMPHSAPKREAPESAASEVVPDIRETAEWQTPTRDQLGLPGEGLTRPVQTRTEQAKVTFTPLHVPTSEPARRLSLKVLMRHILDRAPDVNSGQLDVYRVFIRVDTKLLKRNGIDTLRFEDDRLVEDPELQQAITRSLQRTLGLSMPSDVFV
ncbi:MAG: hypothetical protein MPN21_21665 [Thermoanaerobaculia bacterium]|nr:hypothetical protein [Thermoanaerobaculia bacterium]